MSPDGVSALAVPSTDDQAVYVGGFDVLLRIHAKRPGLWRPFDGADVALDFKITGAADPLGINGRTMRAMLEHGHAVLTAARAQENCPVGKCSAAAYLLWRPPGLTRDGVRHRGAWGFVVLDVNTFMRWDPRSPRAPSRLATMGSLIVEGKGHEPEALPPAPARAEPVGRDRWDELTRRSKRGWVTLHAFVETFSLVGRGDPKYAANRASKRLKGCPFQSDDPQGRGRPPKMARTSDLRRCHPELK